MKERPKHLGAVKVSAGEAERVIRSIKDCFVRCVKPTWKEWGRDQVWPRNSIIKG